MAPAVGRRESAALLAAGAAFLWASYYLFVLVLAPSTSEAAILAWPFVVGGGLFSVYAIAQGHGDALVATWREPSAWGRTGCAVAMQVSTVVVTLAAGPVDPSLLALLGDVVAAPLLLMVVFGEGRGRLHSATFQIGILLCVAGGTLTIVGGESLPRLAAGVWPAAIVLPFSIGLYFVLTARAARTRPLSVLNAQAFLAGGLVALALSPILPGGPSSLLSISASHYGLLVLLGAITFFVAPLAYFVGAQRAGLVLVALLMALIPVFTLALSVGFLRLVPPLAAVAGVPIALAGAFFALQGDPPPNAAPASEGPPPPPVRP